jgi:hypothetical protein
MKVTHKRNNANNMTVYFCQDEGDVIALFPCEITDASGNVLSYQHIGQHGAACENLYKELPECNYNVFAPLLKELIKIGYKNLTIANSQTVELHRQPTAVEIKRGYGATHYKTFEVNDIIDNKTGDLKKWIKCPHDGLRYYH